MSVSTDDATMTVDEELSVPKPGDDRLRRAMDMVPARPSPGDTLTADLTRSQTLAKDVLMMPPHLHGQVGTIMSIIELARHWNMLTVMVARQTYVPKPGQFAFMSQLLHAVIEQNAPITQRIRCEYGRIIQQQQNDGTTKGEWIVDIGAPPEERRCRVWTYVRGEKAPIDYITPPLAKITPKSSPLWVSDPDQQLFYRAVTMFGRRHFPDIIMGCYTPEELAGGAQFIDVTPEDPAKALKERLETQKASDSPREGMEVPPAPVEPQAAPAAPEILPPELKGVDKRSREYREWRKAQQEKEYDDHVATQKAAKAQKPATEAPAPKTALTEPEVPDSLRHEPSPPPKPAMPRNAAEYAEWVNGWLKELDTDSEDQEVRSLAEQAVRDRWKAEMALRNQCGVTSDDRKPILERVNAVIAKLQPAE